MTFSIVAVDKQNGETGFAISSCSWDSGRVGLAEAGVGSIVSQARGNMAFRKLFFEKLEHGVSFEQILANFKEIDEEIEYRQVGMITLDGEALSFTGEKCAYWAGHKIGEDYACQGNILVGPEVIENMTEAFTMTDGSLTDRLYAALQAGDYAGGDARGKQSARIIVVKKGGGFAGDDVIIDITVEDHEEPVREIGRILSAGKEVRHCYSLLRELDEASGEEKLAALERLERYLENHEDRAYFDAWTSLGSMQMDLGMTEKAVSTYKKCLEISPKTIELFRYLVKKNEFPKEILE
jgi:uncharacterized Ntn-hydrolase superfamily protein